MTSDPANIFSRSMNKSDSETDIQRQDSKDLHNTSVASAEFAKPAKQQMFPVYGATPQADPRYQHEKDEYDEMNMTQMTNNLNATNVSHLKKPSVGGGNYNPILTTDGGDETFDVEMIQRQLKGRKDPTGQSMNIFNTSSAGSVKM